MINRKRLLAITGLNLAGKIGQMDDGKLNSFIQSLNQFTGSFPEHEEKIKTALEAEDYAALSKSLSAVRSLLEGVYADELARDCEKQINGLGSAKHEKLEAWMARFLKSLSALSIGIQMALYKDSAAQDAPAAQETAGEGGGRKNEKIILAVDDTPLFLTMLKKTLANIDCKLFCVTSGNDALRFLEKRAADLFLLDIEMPGMNGYELAAKIREKGFLAPLIFLTGNSRKEYVMKALEAGAADFIVKPVNQEDVRAKIARYI
ncbi:MAG: response regulator [Treponema sp.]|jgi:CheY-like chemotaxis protein/HPt (histidine-containing phosphotransfer) domain-containing protein|nr:response regulator [Treponema sp.]